MRIERATCAGEELVAAFARLIPQLAPHHKLPSAEWLARLVVDATVLVARTDDGSIVGVLTMNVYRIPTATHARIDDVVVDAASRGRGVGEALCRDAIGFARAEGANAIYLTSNANRVAANRLYQRLGFTPHETNLYRLVLTPP